MNEQHDERPGAQPAVDRTGGRGELPSAAHVDEIPESLRQRENESDTAHSAFLLYAMQTPAERSNRLVARVLSTAESNVRLWRTKYRWRERCASTPNVEWVALDVYRRRMDEHVGSVHADRLRVALDTVLDSAGFASLRREVQRQRTAQSSRLDERVETTSEQQTSSSDASSEQKQTKLAKTKPNAYASSLAANEIEQIDPARYMRDLAERIRNEHLRPADVKRQIVLIDAVLGLIAQKVKSGELRVRVSDIPALLKARAAITGLPSDALSLAQQTTPTLHQHAHVHVVESVRMRDARASNDEAVVLDAMRAEVDDLRVILNAVPAKRGE